MIEFNKNLSIEYVYNTKLMSFLLIFFYFLALSNICAQEVCLACFEFV